VPGSWLNSLKEEESKHNTAAALREGQYRHPSGPAEKPKTPINRPDKTDKTPCEKLPTPINRPDKTDKIPEAAELGLVATWSAEFGYVSIHDPIEGVWWDAQVKDAPGWALSEARKRKELYRDGNRRAYRLTSREMGEIWEAERSDFEVGIVEDQPVEEES
jgi:hypothetical protein